MIGLVGPISGHARLVLEEDGTDCDEIYLQHVAPIGGIFLILADTERWRPRAWFDYKHGSVPVNDGAHAVRSGRE